MLRRQEVLAQSASSYRTPYQVDMRSAYMQVRWARLCVERRCSLDGNRAHYVGAALAGHVDRGADRRASSDPRSTMCVVRALLQAQVVRGRSGLHRLRGAVGYFRLSILLGRGLQGDIPCVVPMAAPRWIRSAVRGVGACVLASEHPRGQVAGGVVQPTRRLGVSGGPRHRDQPGLAPSASAC